MTKEEIALKLTIEFKNLVYIDSDDKGKEVANFYNSILENIKAE
jgi:hypothetical protein